MKTFLILATLVVVMACNKDDEFNQDYKDTSISWIVGGDHAGDTTVVLPTSLAPMNYLSVEDYSICPNTRLQIIVSSGNEVILDSIYENNFTKYPLETKAGKDTKVQAKLIPGDSLSICVWLGQAVLKYEYGN